MSNEPTKPKNDCDCWDVHKNLDLDSYTCECPCGHKTKPWTYSHTQLALWRLCKRRYYNQYILGKKEPTTDNMAAGTWLCQESVETWESIERQCMADWIGTGSVYWESNWANFLAEFGGDDSYDHPLFTLKLAQKILKAYQANPVQGKVVEIEKTFTHDFGGGLVYTSRPDLVTDNDWYDDASKPGARIHYFRRVTWDIKLKTFNQRYAGDTYYAEAPLSPFDDQCLGQAILAGADSFGQIQFFLGKKDGVLIGPVYMEQPVDPVLAEEWKYETADTCLDIESWRVNAKTTPWPKNSASCHAFGRECPFMAGCGFGFEAKP